MDRQGRQAGGRRREYLFLAPLDDDASAALTRSLKAGGWDFEQRSCALVVKSACHSVNDLRALLDDHIPPLLQARIKAVLTDSDADTPETLMAAFLQAETLPVLLEQAELEWARDVLNDGRLFSVFHPVVEAATGQIFAYEALIRARHPETDETIGAGQLFYACGRLNLQHRLDQCARLCAIRDAAALRLSDARFFINFLPSAVYDPEISLRSTLATANDAGLALDRLVFEVVETEQITNMESVRAILDYYRGQGAGIALDDISSGFSSLQYLTDLLPDYVKIDRDLVAGAAVNASARHTLDSIIGLAKKLNVKVIAEGVETRAEMNVCVESGADYLQGYLFARPANPPEPIPAGLFPPQQEAA